VPVISTLSMNRSALPHGQVTNESSLARGLRIVQLLSNFGQQFKRFLNLVARVHHHRP